MGKPLDGHQRTAVDALVIRSRSAPEFVVGALAEAFSEIPEMKAGRALYGFKHGSRLSVRGICVGEVFWGGSNMAGWCRLELTGTGCREVDNWYAMARLPSIVHDAQIRRCDLAYTVADGSITHELVKAAWRAGAFRDPEGGPSPVMTPWEPQGDPHAGRTVYIGSRKGWRYGRFYEKGRELLSKLPPSERETITHIDGVPVDDLYRAEVEFKATDDRVLPWAMLTERDAFFAGAYPYCRALLATESQAVTLTARAQRRVSLHMKAANIRNQYGTIIHTLLRLEDGDYGAVVRRLLQPTEHPEFRDLTCNDWRALVVADGPQ